MLVYSEACESLSVARKREAEFKRLSRVEKISLISGKNLIKDGKVSSKYILQAKVWKWEGDMAWYFINLDVELSQKIRESRGKGMIKIQVQIGKSSWNTSLLYHTEARAYLIAIKKAIRRKEEIIEGSEVKVKFSLV